MQGQIMISMYKTVGIEIKKCIILKRGGMKTDLAKHCKTMNNEKQKRQKKNKKYNVVNRKS
jgi:hypothetical protein